MFYREIFIGYCKSNEQFQVWNPSIKKVKICTHLVFVEHKKGDQLLINSDWYDDNWEASIDSDIVDNDYSPLSTPQKLAQRHTESEKSLPSDSEIIESVRDLSEFFTKVQRLGLNTENQDKNSHMRSENSENDREAQNSDSEASETIHIDIRSVREKSESVKHASTEKMSWYEQILRLNSQYINVVIQKHIHKSASYKEVMRSLTYRCQWG